MAGDQVMRFTLSGREFAFDFDPKLLTGDQTEIIRRHADMPALAFLKAGINITLDNFDERMLLLLAYLSEYRSNELLEWGSFIRTVAPFDVVFLQEPVDASEIPDPPEEKTVTPRRRASAKS